MFALLSCFFYGNLFFNQLVFSYYGLLIILCNYLNIEFIKQENTKNIELNKNNNKSIS